MPSPCSACPWERPYAWQAPNLPKSTARADALPQLTAIGDFTRTRDVSILNSGFADVAAFEAGADYFPDKSKDFATISLLIGEVLNHPKY